MSTYRQFTLISNDSQLTCWIEDDPLLKQGARVTLKDYPEMIRAVTVDDVSRVSRQYIAPDALTTVVVGPVDESGKLLE